jgi:Domain of unknown function (DUF4314)
MGAMKFNESASLAHIGDPYPVEKGARIVLVTMPHDPDPVPRGTKGTVTGGNGEQVWVKWDNGRTLNLAVDKDVWAVLDGIVLVDDGYVALQLDDIETDQRHDCAVPGCQHVASYKDEAFCWYHEPPIGFEHDCAFQKCAHWSTK